jgi:NADH-quinone oxidoreductase subunit L
MHAVEHDPAAAQDMRNMGGLARVMPLTARTYFIACLAITAAPIPLLAGFWSKDEILWRALNTENIGAVPGALVYAMGLAAAVGTSFYMWRSYFLTFEGPHEKPELADQVTESPAWMTYVLAVLALLSIVAGAALGFSPHLWGAEGEPLLESWLRPSLRHAEVRFAEPGLPLEYAFMALSVGLTLVAYAVARGQYGASRRADWQLRERRLPLFAAIQNGYWVDQFYRATFVAGVLRLRLVLADTDRWVVDGLVNGSAILARGCAWLSGTIDRHFVDGAVNFVAEGVLSAGDRLRTVQTGRIQNYVYGLLGGVAFLSLLRYFIAK